MAVVVVEQKEEEEERDEEEQQQQQPWTSAWKSWNLADMTTTDPGQLKA